VGDEQGMGKRRGGVGVGQDDIVWGEVQLHGYTTVTTPQATASAEVGGVLSILAVEAAYRP
jgi:hypothetical protein